MAQDERRSLACPLATLKAHLDVTQDLASKEHAMTSVVIIADSGAEMARLTATVDAAPGMVLVRHASGRAPVASIVADHQPTLVVLGRDVAAAPRARAAGRDPRASPDSRIVVVAEDAGARRLGSALAAGATAVIPGGPSAEALGNGAPGGPRRRHGRRAALMPQAA